jgi:hypothetical protein
MKPKQGVTLLPNGSCQPPLARGSSKGASYRFPNDFFVDEFNKVVVSPLKVPEASPENACMRSSHHIEAAGTSQSRKGEGSPETSDGGGSPCERQRRRMDYSSGQLGAGQRARAAI